MMFCYQCGKKQPVSSNFCFECGADLAQAEAEVTTPSPTVTEECASSEAIEIQTRADVATTTNPHSDDEAIFSSGAYPWRRYFAHFIDIVTLGLAGSFALGVLLYTLFPNSSADLNALFENPLVSLMLVYLATIPLEAALLSSTGTSLGKGIFGIRISHIEGRLLSFSEALQRGFSRWLRAEGLGIPIIILIANISAYRRLTGHGVTTYDENLRVSVKHKKWGPGRAIFATLSAVVAFMLLSIVNAMLT